MQTHVTLPFLRSKLYTVTINITIDVKFVFCLVTLCKLATLYKSHKLVYF